MRARLFRRPSASMIVAVLALVVAASGTAVAASSLVSGDKLIKKHSLSGNRLRNHTITGKQVKLSKLGKVPSAHNADFATNAGNAGNANTATNAGNASNLGGQPASNYVQTSTLHRTGIRTLNSGQTGVTLLQDGSVSVTADCTTTSGTIDGALNQASTSSDWWDFDSHKTAPGSFDDFDASSASTTPSANNGRIQVGAADGSGLQGQGWIAVNWPSAGQCSYQLYGIS